MGLTPRHAPSPSAIEARERFRVEACVGPHPAGAEIAARARTLTRARVLRRKAGVRISAAPLSRSLALSPKLSGAPAPNWTAPGLGDTLICPGFGGVVICPGKIGVGMLESLAERIRMPRSYPPEVRRQVIELRSVWDACRRSSRRRSG